MNKTITIETVVRAPIESVWDAWTNPVHIKQWLHASEDWECPHAENDLRVGARFTSTMAAKDKSVSFDFTGIYTTINPNTYIAYTIDDGRTVEISFKETEEGVLITETFEMENENPEEMQRAGWQAILDNFRSYTETLL